MLSDEIIERLRQLKNPEKSVLLMRFFKTGPGEYGEGDKFWGISVPTTRSVVRELRPHYAPPRRSYEGQVQDLRIENLNTELEKAVTYPIHEVRLAGLLVLVQIAKKYPIEAAKYYLNHTQWINNWDLVDLTADRVVGPIIDPKDLRLLKKLAVSKSVWERRIAMMTTFHFIYLKNPQPALTMAELLMHDQHDLIYKASGWMLREVGKRCGEKYLTDFLDKHYQEMPRTMLRYAIERLSENKRRYYMGK